ncbi:MAG TPA: alkyl sulfatase dimerization domain-containing protein [Acidimicrobiales bacterium]|nr:alkyl sulfatase dimerization domain-containing protein [Acidimicrobiales bacterium]
MSEDVFALVDKLWDGRATVTDHHPVTQAGSLVEVSDNCAFIPSFANVSAFSTLDGLVLVDTGSQFLAQNIHTDIRRWNHNRLDTAVYSHGHIDHVFGVPLFEQESINNGWKAPRVIAHEALPARFDRYILTAGYNGVINQRQFGVPGLTWPTEYRYPDETYSDSTRLEIGGTIFELRHARGETDDHTWTWIPSLRTICCGDLFIWASPNAGNPQKVQRYPKEWAACLREMVALEPEVLLPGHGFPIRGKERIVQALTDTADFLDFLVDRTLELMNAGTGLNEILHSVEVPKAFMEKPYLKPVYDEPEFIVRNTWRQYGGWYDGDPSNLKPARRSDLAKEISSLAGGSMQLASRAQALAGSGDFRLACHLIELASLADPDDRSIHGIRAEIYRNRVAQETSTMAKGIFGWAATESESRA